MGFVEDVELDDNYSAIRIVTDLDPARTCPSEATEVHIYPLRSYGGISLKGIDDLFEVLDREQRDATVSNTFPVFAANLEGATVHKFDIVGNLQPHIVTRIRLLYCVAMIGLVPTCDGSLGYGYDAQGRYFSAPNPRRLHSPETHRRDVIDTAISLAEFALAVTRRRPELPRQELRMPLSDQ